MITNKLVKFAAERIDEEGNTLNGSEVKVTADGTFLNVVYQKDGENLFHLINPHWRLWMLQLHVQISAEVRSDRQLV